MKIECTVYDQREGRLHILVEAESEDAAYEEAGIAAAERGCTNVTDIVVGIFE